MSDFLVILLLVLCLVFCVRFVSYFVLYPYLRPTFSSVFLLLSMNLSHKLLLKWSLFEHFALILVLPYFLSIFILLKRFSGPTILSIISSSSFPLYSITLYLKFNSMLLLFSRYYSHVICITCFRDIYFIHLPIANVVPIRFFSRFLGLELGKRELYLLFTLLLFSMFHQPIYKGVKSDVF